MNREKCRTSIFRPVEIENKTMLTEIKITLSMIYKSHLIRATLETIDFLKMMKGHLVKCESITGISLTVTHYSLVIVTENCQIREIWATVSV